MESYVAGLDIGTTKIACIIAQADEEVGMRVVGIGVAPSLGLRKGVVVNMEKTVQGIRKAVHEAELMAGFDIDSVYVGIAGEHIQSFNRSGSAAVQGGTGEITENDIDRAHENASAIPHLRDRETLHTVPQTYVVDDQIGIKDPTGMSGVLLETSVHIITASEGAARNIYKCVETANLEVNGIVLEPYASSFSVLEKDEKEIGVALVDMGGGTTDLALYVNDALTHTAVVGLGGEYVTKDIAMGIRTPLEKAEEIKKEFGCADPKQVVSGEEFPVPGVGGREERQVSRAILTTIIEPRVEEILSLAAREIEKTGCASMLGAGVVLTGGGAMLEGIREVAERVFQMPVKLGVPVGFSSPVEAARSPMHATGIGLCLYALLEDELEKSEKKGGAGAGVNGFFASVVDWFKRYF